MTALATRIAAGQPVIRAARTARSPFTSYEGLSGPSELPEEVRGEGARETVGELMTCPFCTSV